MLLENPIPVIFVGIVVEAVLASIFANTGRNVMLLAMVGVFLLVLAGVVLERVVVTEKEVVEATLDGVVDALEDNDLDRLLSEYVSPSAAHTRLRAETALAIVEITRAKVHNLEVTINHLTSPPTAEARFDGIVWFRGRQPGIHPDRYAAKFVAELQWEGDRWMITDHLEYEMQRL